MEKANKIYKIDDKKIINKKQKNLLMVEMRNELKNKNLLSMTENTYERLKSCGTYMEFLNDLNFEKKKLLRANFCKNRFCAICSKNKAVKDSIAFKIITNYVKLKLNRAFIFVTLTAPNCKGEDLKSEIDKYNNAFITMTKRKDFKFIKGFVRKLEVTYNPKTDTYHPHFHILISVNKNYFTNTHEYMKRDKWLQHWQEVMSDFTITQVDVRKVKENKNGVDNSILELTKYIAKDSNYLFNLDVFKNFYLGLKGKRVFSFGGDFKEARKKLKAKELEEFYEEDLTEWIYFVKKYWNFELQKYDNKILDLRKLTPEEVQQILINNQLSIDNIIKDCE